MIRGLGAGWRPELARAIERRDDLAFVEIVAEATPDPIPRAVAALREEGLSAIPHGVSLGLGSADRPDVRRLDRLARLAEGLEAPCVSEHVAFVRGAGLETGHLLPIPRTEESLAITIENVSLAQRALPVPLVLENIAAGFAWPESTMDDGEFLTRLLDATGAGLLLDVANLHANALNFGLDPVDELRRMPLERIVYVHVAGGTREDDGYYRDSHAHDVPPAAFALLEELAAHVDSPAVLLERDDRWPSLATWNAELDRIRTSIDAGRRRRATRLSEGTGV